MPIYRYACDDCSYEQEYIIKHSDLEEFEKLVVCNKCKSENFKRAISKTTFSLKGEGWYRDGYK